MKMYRGVNISMEMYRGVNILIEMYRGVNILMETYKGVNSLVEMYKCVNILMEMYRGVNISDWVPPMTGAFFGSSKQKRFLFGLDDSVFMMKSSNINRSDGSYTTNQMGY